jgi:hypothetical protein
LKPILIWPVQMPRSFIKGELGQDPEQFVILTVDEQRSAQRAEGLARGVFVFDPYYLLSAGAFGRFMRSRFDRVVQGVPSCRSILCPSEQRWYEGTENGGRRSA